MAEKCEVARVAREYLSDKDHWIQEQLTNARTDDVEIPASISDTWDEDEATVYFAARQGMEIGCCVLGSIVYACGVLDDSELHRHTRSLSAFAETSLGRNPVNINDEDGYDAVMALLADYEKEVCK